MRTNFYFMLLGAATLPTLVDAQQRAIQNSQYSVLGQPTTLPQGHVGAGLKEALLKGVQFAVRELGHEGGFLTNLNVRIPMPKQLQSVEKHLRFLKQDQLPDEFVATMNYAAERTIPEGYRSSARPSRG